MGRYPNDIYSPPLAREQERNHGKIFQFLHASRAEALQT
jgi:hypothetical protein